MDVQVVSIEKSPNGSFISITNVAGFVAGRNLHAAFVVLAFAEPAFVAFGI